MENVKEFIALLQEQIERANKLLVEGESDTNDLPSLIDDTIDGLEDLRNFE